MLNLRTIETGCRRAPNRVPVSFASSADYGAEALICFKDGKTRGISPDGIPVPLLEAERILVPFDFSTGSLRVLQWVISASEHSDGIVSVLHVVHPWIPPLHRAEPYDFDPNEERAKSARSLLRDLLERAHPTAGPIGVRAVIGRPAEEIVRYAQLISADLIVMAPGRPTRLLERLFSGTTQNTVRLAPCPVLVLPGSAPKFAELRPASGTSSVVKPEVVAHTAQR